MIERPPALSKLLPLLAADGRLAEALTAVWIQLGPPLADRLGWSTAEQERLCGDCLATLRNWSTELGEGRARRAPLHQWLVRLRQDVSLEGLLLALVQLDRALRQAGWQLGLSAPDWLALSELMSGFFEALFEEAAAGWQGLLAQNHQLRDELGYFHRLAASLESGQALGEHLQMAVRETARLLHCEFCAILLPTEQERDVLSIRAAVAPRILSSALDGMAFPLSENGLIAQVFLTGAPASTYQPLDDLEVTMRRRQTLESLGFSQLMAYPLQTHGRVLGVLCVANRLDDQPWQALEEEWLSTVAGQLSASVRLSQLFSRQESSEAELSRALLAMMANKDPRLLAHGEGVGAIAADIAAMLGIGGTRLESLVAASRLHDLGLLFLPDAVRLRPGPLWASDLPVVRRHPALAADLIAAFKPLEALAPAVRHHHEWWDGTGYPGGLRGQDIPLEARILAVADGFHTLTTPQPYQEARSVQTALDEMSRAAGTQFDPLVVQALIQAHGRPEAFAAPPVVNLPHFRPGQPGPDAIAAEAPEANGAPLQTPRLLALMAELVAASDSERFSATFWEALVAHIPLDAATIWRVQGIARLEAAEAFGWIAFPGTRLVSETGLETYVAACQVPVATVDLGADRRFELSEGMRQEGFVSAMALPLVVSDRLLGVLTVYRRRSSAFSAAEQGLVELAAAMLANGLEAQELRARHRDAVLTDPLTGLPSHRAFAERVQTELKRAERFDLPIGALLLDLDAFGSYNELNGYSLGDEVLKQVAGLLGELLRPVDFAARFGADAFAVLMPECTPPEALRLAEELRQAVAAALFPGRQAGGARLTACIGVTTRQAGVGTREAFLADLRAASARAKDEGTNRLLFHATALAEES